MNISYLRTYVTLAKNGNISQTAVLLGYSKSTIYDQLKSLESELGTKLYQRVQHGITSVSYTHLDVYKRQKI